jgi:uncharacterized membrane protein YkoI
MNQKYALTLAVGITAFVLVVGGGIAAKFGHPASAPATAVAPMPTATDIQAFYAQREAEYQAQIDAANQALAEAYAQLEAASTATQQPQSTATQDPQSTPTPDFYLTPQGAMSAAILTVPGATILSVPELVNYQGIVAYEVRLDSGIVYVDASNGAVLYNGAAQAQVPAPARRHGDDNENGHDD